MMPQHLGRYGLAEPNRFLEVAERQYPLGEGSARAT